MIWKIAMVNPDQTIRYAAEELKKYLEKIDASCEAILLLYSEHKPEMEGVLWLAIDKAFPLPEVKNPEYDDAISVKVHGKSGYISGTNPRSVLFAVYRFLGELGCAFVRPGEDGEGIPSQTLDAVDVELFEAAATRHRAIWIESAVSETQLLKIIEWLPKVGMNGYFFQHLNPYIFFNQWYSHLDNPLRKPEEFDREASLGVQDYLLSEIKKRGLMTYGVGHEWTAKALGFAKKSRSLKDAEIPEEMRPYFAMLDGKRGLLRDSLNITQLCYSSKDVQKLLAKAVREYAQANPLFDCLGFFLADGRNNFCECENCSGHRPSDDLIEILNEIDRELAAHNLKTKIFFCVYMDLLWEPTIAKLENPDRFIFSLATYGRRYADSLQDFKTAPQKDFAPYERNKNVIPSNEAVLLRILENWKKFFKEDDVVILDYQMMWDHYRDAGYYDMAELIFKDMRALDKMQANGYMSCQTQRVFLPTSLCMVSMAAALWNRKAKFEDVAAKYFAESFGPYGGQAQEYLKTISGLFDHCYWRGMREMHNAEMAVKFEKGVQEIAKFKPFIEKQIQDAEKNGLNPAQTKSWEYLIPHGNLYTWVGKSFVYLAQGDLKRAGEMQDHVVAYAREIEEELQYIFDAFQFINVYRDLSFKNRLKAAEKEKEEM